MREKRFPFTHIQMVLLLTGMFITAAIPTPVTSQKIPENQSEAIKQAAESIVGIQCKAKGEDCFGTGIVVHSNGVVLTTPSTVPPAEAKDIQVKTASGKEYEGSIKHVVESRDAVFLKVDANDLTPASFRTPDELKVGDISFTVGNVERISERNEEFSISMGIISGKYSPADTGGYVPAKFGTTYHRGDIVYFPIRRKDHYTGPMIETTASTNQGNDGGALIDIHGNVIGMMTLSYSQHRWLGLAIPISKLKSAIKSALEKVGLKPAKERTKKNGSGDLKNLQKRYKELLSSIRKSTVAIQIEHKKIEPSKNREDELKKDWYYGPPSPMTGTVISEDGYIVTNDDRMQARGEIKEIIVKLPDGTEKTAELVEEADDLDLALLKIDASGLKTLPDQSKNSFQTGTFVVAPGRAPATDSPTMTAGIVVSPPGDNHKEFLVDAEINAGNLGGPVVSLDGNLMGVSVHPERYRPNSKMAAVVTVQKLKESFSQLK